MRGEVGREKNVKREPRFTLEIFELFLGGDLVFIEDLWCSENRPS